VISFFLLDLQTLSIRWAGSLSYWFFTVVLCVFIVPWLIGSLSVSVRRLHDTDSSAWSLLLFLIPFLGFMFLLILLSSKGSSGDNQFGPSPVAEEA